MHAMVRLVVHGRPEPKGSAKAFVPKGWTRPIVTSDNTNLKAWERTIRGEIQRVMAHTDRDVLAALFDAPIGITITCHLARPTSLAKRVTAPTKRPDLDKIVRGILDPLTGLLFHDDAQVTRLRARKLYAASSPFVEILVEAVDLLDTDPIAPDPRGVLPYGDAAR